MYTLEGIAPRFHRENDLLGLLFLKDGVPRMFVLRILTAEYPNNLQEFSLGSANALAVAGTGWVSIEDSSGNEIFEPEKESRVNQVFFGIAPSYARVYRQYPAGVERGNLRGTRAIGSQTGYVNGVYSPLHDPNPNTEFFVIKGQFPAFNGYLPYKEPASANIYASFYVASFAVCELDPAGLTPEEWRRVRRITVGGKELMDAPGWLKIGHLTTQTGPV